MDTINALSTGNSLFHHYIISLADMEGWMYTYTSSPTSLRKLKVLVRDNPCRKDGVLNTPDNRYSVNMLVLHVVALLSQRTFALLVRSLQRKYCIGGLYSPKARFFRLSMTLSLPVSR